MSSAVLLARSKHLPSPSISYTPYLLIEWFIFAGKCNDGINSFSCNCSKGFFGKTCHNGTDECSPNPCASNANCTDLHLDYKVSLESLDKIGLFNWPI